MKNIVLSLFLIISLAKVGFADDSNLTLTVGGIVYSNVTFGTATPQDVTVHHSCGILKVPLAALPSEPQIRFGYNPERAKQYQEEARKLAIERQEVQKKNQKYREKLKNALPVLVEVTQVLPNGVLALFQFVNPGMTPTMSGVVFVSDYPQFKNCAVGDKFFWMVYREGVISYTSVQGAPMQVANYHQCGTWQWDVPAGQSMGFPKPTWRQ